MSKNLLIIPAYNEAEVIGETLDSINNLNLDIDILVINDGSTDETSNIAKKKNVIVIDMPYNIGVGSASHIGYLYAFENDYEKAIRFDADGQHNQKDIKTMLDNLDNYDIVLSSRFSKKSNYKISGIRNLSIKILSFIASLRLKVKITDITNGFRGANKSGIQQLVEFYPFEYLGDTVQATVGAGINNLKIFEFYSPLNQRVKGTASQNNLKLFYHMLRATISLLILITRRKV